MQCGIILCQLKHFDNLLFFMPTHHKCLKPVFLPDLHPGESGDSNEKHKCEVCENSIVIHYNNEKSHT